ncbi:protein WHAT'S THIS FACTOR 1, chloroplastic [Salvia divinorum]|uniref:Protein WHAT'S THIS FACTOR 1, chloroplastic n=1 Tax=Salvia divinorum TaxID=28513 RepID=A0ABD1GNG8_SALDI
MAALAFAPSVSPPWHLDSPTASASLGSHFVPKLGLSVSTRKRCFKKSVVSTSCSASPHKIIRDPRLDKHVVKQKKMRFVQKLKTLLLSKPKHFMPIQILYKCRGYLSLRKPHSILPMIRRYPTVFELFYTPTPRTPFHAAGPLSQLCVRLTPPAAALAKKESDLKKSMTISLAAKLQKLLMLASPYHRLLLYKLVHLAPDLGLPVNFCSRLCNDHPDRFKVVDTSYGRALELVSWDSSLAEALPWRDEDSKSLGLIVDRPLKFKHLRLRKGLNIKRWHHEYLIKFKELPDVCPYTSNPEELAKESIRAEKRACAVVREVLGMTMEKRTLVDHLTHFRKEFGLSNKVRGMLVRHPELFYISLKGHRDSVFLVEGYSDKGRLLEKNDIMVIKDEMMKLVLQGKRLRRKEVMSNNSDHDQNNTQTLDDQVDDDDEYYDGLDDLFQVEDFTSDDDGDDDCGDDESKRLQEEGKFWSSEGTALLQYHNACSLGPW